MKMEIKILQHKLNNNTYKLYDVTFFQATISTVVTSEPSAVDTWITDTERTLDGHIDRPEVVGLDVEWRPNFIKNNENPIATVQLCAGQRCLIFQIIHSPIIPYSLLYFLGNPAYVFTGVGIDEDVEKLMRHYYLKVARTADLRTLAVAKYGGKRGRALKNAGLKRLSCKVLRRDISKPKRVTMSYWDYPWLHPLQVQYACIDAFVSSEIGRVLISGCESTV